MMRSVVPVVFVCLLPLLAAHSASAWVPAVPASARSQAPAAPDDNPLNAIAKRLAKGAAKGEKPAASLYTFKPSGGRLALDDLVETLGEGDEQKKAIRELLTAGFTGFEEAVKKEGKANDVAAAFAFFIATHYTAATGKPVSDGAGDAIYKQIQSLFADPAMKDASDADKQRFWETCVGLSTFTLGIAEAATDAETKASLKKVAAATFQSLLSVPVSSVKITDKGIEVIGASTPTPAAAAIGSTSNLSYAVPAGWTEQKEDGGVLLNRTVKTDEGQLVVNAVLMLGAAQAGNPNELCQAFYKKYLVPQIPEGTVRNNKVVRDLPPEVYRRLVGNGLRCYFTGNFWNKRKDSLDYSGTSQEWHVYYVETGGKWVPVMVSMTGEWGRDERGILLSDSERYNWLEDVLRSLKGTPSGKPLFVLSEFVGDFKTSFSSAGPMMYSTISGGAVGMNMVAGSTRLITKATGAFQYQYGGATTFAGGGTNFGTQKNAGKVSLTNDSWGAFLVLNGNERTSKYRLVSASTLPGGQKQFITLMEAEKPTLSFIWRSPDVWRTPEKE